MRRVAFQVCELSLKEAADNRNLVAAAIIRLGRLLADDTSEDGEHVP